MTETVPTSCEDLLQDDRATESVGDGAVVENASADDAQAPEKQAVPEPAPVVGGLAAFFHGGRRAAAEALGPSSEGIVGQPGDNAPDYAGWNGAAKIADAFVNLAFGRAAAEDCAVRVIAESVHSPIARRVLPECAELAVRGVRFSIILNQEPRQADEIAALAGVSRALGVPRLDDFVRIADFPGAEMCLEQAMIGDQFYWTGEPLARRRPTPLPAGATIDLTRTKAAPDAARLRFAAAWRLAGEPSHAFCRRVAAAARAL